MLSNDKHVFTYHTHEARLISSHLSSLQSGKSRCKLVSKKVMNQLGMRKGRRERQVNE